MTLFLKAFKSANLLTDIVSALSFEQGRDLMIQSAAFMCVDRLHVRALWCAGPYTVSSPPSCGYMISLVLSLQMPPP